MHEELILNGIGFDPDEVKGINRLYFQNLTREDLYRIDIELKTGDEIKLFYKTISDREADWKSLLAVTPQLNTGETIL